MDNRARRTPSTALANRNTGYIRHALQIGSGIFFTATDESPLYWPERAGWLIVDDRPFSERASKFARWARHKNVLFVSSLENATGVPSDGGDYNAVYCDQFDSRGGVDTFKWCPR